MINGRKDAWIWYLVENILHSFWAISPGFPDHFIGREMGYCWKQDDAGLSARMKPLGENEGNYSYL